jgi:ribose transport system ATP-binding protein/rhamnose transport system ATP-binding protein
MTMQVVRPADVVASTPVIVEAVGVTRRYPGVTALDGVDFELQMGEVHALLGENGAGKSTLVRLISGAEQPDEGAIRVAGETVLFREPRDARAAGIRTVTQERTLVPTLSVAENIFLGDLPRTRLGTVDWTVLWERAEGLLDRLSMEVDPTVEVGRLPPAKQQLVEIARALSRSARALILDEPTAALSAQETAHLFEAIRALRADGVAVLYISHRVGELAEIADRVTVLRDGRRLLSTPFAGTARAELVRAMVGRELGDLYPSRLTEPGRPLLVMKGVTAPGICADLDLTVRAGEVVGVFGLVGSGATEVPYVAAGDVPAEGHIERIGLPGLVPVDRRSEGLFPRSNVQRNIGAASIRRYVRTAVFRSSLERAGAERQIEALSVRPPRASAPVAGLSGGNQQKTILGRWLEQGAELLLLSEPTRGVDVGARADIYAILTRLCESGAGVLMASSDIEEVAGLCDRVHVLVRGACVATIERPAITEETLLEAATR